MRDLNRRRLLAGMGAVGSTALAGCSSIGSLNPFASDGDKSESLPGPFREVRAEGYDLVVAFDPPQTVAANESGEDDSESGSEGNASQQADSSNVTQVLLRNSAGKDVRSAALGNGQVISFPLIQLGEDGIGVEDRIDLGRYTIIAVGPNGEYEHEITLTPEIEVTNVTLPNQMENVSTPSSPLSFANPIIEFSNTGTSPAIIVESSYTGGNVPNEREEADQRDEEENVEAGALVAQFNDTRRTEQSIIPLTQTAIPVAESVGIQTGFSPLAVPQSRYEAGGEEGGGIDNLRSKFAEEEVDANCTLQIREGTTYKISMKIGLGGGISEVTGLDGTEYYVFRNPTINSWKSETEN